MSPLALALLGMAVTAQSGETEPLVADVRVERGPYFVGQSVGITVRAASGSGRPAIVPPRIRGGALVGHGTGVEPISTSAIGDSVHEYNRYLYHYDLRIEGAGPFIVPPFQLRQGSHFASTDPVRLSIRSIPPNRPSTFLGSIGPIKVEAEATPVTVRLGERFEYRVKVTGPGAHGIRGAPSLERLKRLPIAPSVEAVAEERVDSPPKRFFRFRLRPTKPGEVTLPPLVVTWFDPRTQQFPAAVSGALPLRVVSADLEASMSEFPPIRAARSWWRGRPIALGIGAVAGAAVAAASIWAGRRWWRKRQARFQPSSWARATAARFETAAEGRDVPREITDALAEFLHHASGRPTGALTPAEARIGVARITGNTELSEGAERLLGKCDAQRFDESPTIDAQERLSGHASRFFASLAGNLARRKHRERHSRPSP